MAGMIVMQQASHPPFRLLLQFAAEFETFDTSK